jgi:hypothetical protein
MIQETNRPDNLAFVIGGKICDDDPALVHEHEERSMRELEAENRRLRVGLYRIRQAMEKVADPDMNRVDRVKHWGRYTLINTFTQTLPRIVMVWGGAAVVAYAVTKFMG